MALSPRSESDEVLHALVAAHNSTRVGLVASFYHADITSAVTTGLDGFTPTAASLTANVANAAVTLATVITLANELLVKGNIHMADAIAHKVADTTNGPYNASAVALLPLAAAATQTQVNTQVTAMKAGLNAHFIQTGVHYTNDAVNTIVAADATTLGTSITLVNAIKAAYNAHIASAPGGSSIALIPA